MTFHFTGREQVSAGVVPIDSTAAGKGTKGCQSALAVYPLAIANCTEKRYVAVGVPIVAKWTKLSGTFKPITTL